MIIIDQLFCFFLHSHRRNNPQQVQHIHRRLSADRDDRTEIGTTQGRTTVEVRRSILLCHNGSYNNRYVSFNKTQQFFSKMFKKNLNYNSQCSL